MNSLIDRVDRIIAGIAITGAWVTLFILIGVRVFDIVARQFMTTPSALLALYERRAFAFLVILGIGYAYTRNSHVRVDILRDRWNARIGAWIEVLGGLFALLPLCAAVVMLYWPFVWDSYVNGERSWFFLGLPLAWVVKGLLPVGFLLLAVAGANAIVRNILFLRGGAAAPWPDIKSE